MPQSLCVRCQVEYRPKRNDIVVEEMASFGSANLWCADLWECPNCKHLMITGYGSNPYAQHWQNDYPIKLKRARESGVYQCHEFREVDPEPSEAMQTRLEREAEQEVRNLDKVIGDTDLISDYRAAKFHD